MLSPDCYPATGFVAVLLVMWRELMPFFPVLLSGPTHGVATHPSSSAGGAEGAVASWWRENGGKQGGWE